MEKYELVYGLDYLIPSSTGEWVKASDADAVIQQLTAERDTAILHDKVHYQTCGNLAAQNVAFQKEIVALKEELGRVRSQVNGVEIHGGSEAPWASRSGFSASAHKAGGCLKARCMSDVRGCSEIRIGLA